MKITIAAIGKSKLREEKAWGEQYMKRLPWKVSLVEIPESKAQTAALRKSEEAAKLKPYIDKADAVIALDETGDTPTSKAFATRLGKAASDGHSNLLFIIGGADGLHPSIPSAAAYTLALGRMTWPHLMVRVMLLEQLYRAYTILQGHPYHRE
jgi:23S rRNA (pseudouridine1915-N3)-methyltransferase